MFDKLKLTSKKPIPIESIHNIDWGNSCIKERITDPQYNKCFILKKSGSHMITVKTRGVFHTISPLQIEVNPSKFDSLNDLFLLLSKFAPISTYEITRIDHCCDINVNIQTLFQTVKARRKQKRTDYDHDENINGFTIGNKPEVICIYNKNFERTKRGTFKRVSREYVDVSRVEIRHFKDKVKFKNLSDIEKYKGINPFNCIEFLGAKDISKLRDRERDKLKSIENLLNDKSLQSFYKLTNKHSNFNRTYSKYFEPLELNQEIHQQYKQNLERFFRS